jgi:hypothetical protein
MALQSSLWAFALFHVLLLRSVRRTPRIGISPLQGLYLHTGWHKWNELADIHASSGFRTHDPAITAGEFNSCIILRRHSDCSHLILGWYNSGKRDKPGRNQKYMQNLTAKSQTRGRLSENVDDVMTKKASTRQRPLSKKLHHQPLMVKSNL